MSNTMKSSVVISRCAVLPLLLLLMMMRLVAGSTLKSNAMSTIQRLKDTSSRNIITHLHGSSSRSAFCPVLPPCRCVQQVSTSRVRVTCDRTEVSRRRVLRFAKSSVVTRSFDQLSLAYAGLNTLPAGTFRHVKVTFQ